MNIFTHTLATALLVAVPTFAHAEDTADAPATIGECRDLTCFGRLAIREKLADGTIKLPLTLYSQAQCDAIAGTVPSTSCKVISKPRYSSTAQAWVFSNDTRSYDWHDLASFGAVYIGELFYDRQTINAVALATGAECRMINFAMEPDGAVPCFHMDAMPAHFTQQHFEDSIRR